MNEELHEQASLYVLDLLEGDDAVNFEKRMQSDAELRALVDELDEAAALIAHDAPQRELPPELRARLLGQIRSGKTIPLPRRATWIPWAIAAALALSCAYLLSERGSLRKRITHLEERDLLAQIQITSLRSELKNAPDANAVVIWDERKQRGVLKVTQVPRNAADRDYQLWMIDPRYKNPVSAGVFHVANEGSLRVPFEPVAPVREPKGFAISLERKGGVTKAEGPIILLGK
jgi:anti-sigma-K factor RskA